MLHVLESGAGLGAIVAAAKDAGIQVQRVDRRTLDQRWGGTDHQGVMLETLPFPYVDLHDALAKKPSLVLVLDGVEDPRNLGRAARNALAYGADLLVLPTDRACKITALAENTAVGALAQLPVAQVTNLRRALGQMKDAGLWLVGAEADGPSTPWDVDLAMPTALIIGGEDSGVRRLTREACDAMVHVPMAAKGFSLNAADAAGVLLFEALRQRQSQS